MIFFLLGLGVLVLYEYKDAKRRGFGWREFKGVTKMLLLGPAPVPKCRVCEVECPNPILRDDLGHGAVVCLECSDEVRLEAGLIRPDWFDKPLPPEAPEVAKQPEDEVDPLAEAKKRATGELPCLNCGSNDPCACSLRHVKVRVCEWCPRPTKDGADLCDRCIVGGRPHPPGDLGDNWFKDDDYIVKEGAHTAVGDYKPLAKNFRASGELRAPNPRLRIPAERPHRRSVPISEMAPATKIDCDFCHTSHPLTSGCASWD